MKKIIFSCLLLLTLVIFGISLNVNAANLRDTPIKLSSGDAQAPAQESFCIYEKKEITSQGGGGWERDGVGGWD